LAKTVSASAYDGRYGNWSVSCCKQGKARFEAVSTNQSRANAPPSTNPPTH